MLRHIPTPAAGFVVLAFLSASCEPTSNGTGTEPSVTSIGLPPAPPAVTKAKELVLILPGDHAEFRAPWEQIARAEAGSALAILEVKKPKPGDPPARQAEIVREEAKRGVSALIILPGDPEVIAPALIEARDKGIPIVLLSRPVPVDGKPLPLVTIPPIDELARVLVDAALKDSQKTGFPRTGPALILANSRSDDQCAARTAALQTAVKNAGVTLIDTVTIGGDDTKPLDEQAQKAVETVAASHPKIAMILAADDHGLTGAVLARDSLRDKGNYALVGFMTNPGTVYLVRVRECSSVADLNTSAIARQGVRTALRLINGEKVPEQILVDNVSRGSASLHLKVVPPSK